MTSYEVLSTLMEGPISRRRRITMDGESLTVLRAAVAANTEKNPLDVLIIQTTGTKGHFGLMINGGIVTSPTGKYKSVSRPTLRTFVGKYTLEDPDECKITGENEIHTLLKLLLEDIGGEGRSDTLLTDLLGEYTFSQYWRMRSTSNQTHPDKAMGPDWFIKRCEEKWLTIKVGIIG